MPDLLQQGEAWLTEQRHEHMTHEVHYRRGAATIALNATVGRTEWEQTDEHGLIQRIESRDFLVRTADLVDGGNPFLPAPGDQIVDGAVYEVMAMADEQSWRYSATNRGTVRIHTKMVGSV